MGDGILGLFSIPNKDDSGTADAISAIYAALEMKEVFENLTTDWTNIWKGYIEKNVNIDISLRYGINTGYVIYGNIGSDKSDQLTAVGMRVNIASRLESKASPNKIVISTTTKERMHNHFNCNSLGIFPDLKNVTGEFEIFDFYAYDRII